MSGWIDPLGVHTLNQYASRMTKVLRDKADTQERAHPKSRTAAKYRARLAEVRRWQQMIQRATRPGSELLPYKDLVQSGSETRRQKLQRIEVTSSDAKAQKGQQVKP